MDTNYIKLGDCLELLKEIPDNSIDLIVTDPPYEFQQGGGGGTFGSKNRSYHKEYISLYHEEDKNNDLKFISKGFDLSLLDEFCRVLKKINIYIWCSKSQLGKIINYFEEKNCSIDLLTWHKTNPTPTCNNTYLSDTEYCIFAREKGVKLYGTYHTKKKYYITPINKSDKKLYNHPTIKPLKIIQNLIINSSNEGDIVLDPFLGSWTTAVASKMLKRQYIGFEINKDYFEIAQKRIDNTLNITNEDKLNQTTLFDLIKKED